MHQDAATGFGSGAPTEMRRRLSSLVEGPVHIPLPPGI